jgi:hypothetical protein
MRLATSSANACRTRSISAGSSSSGIEDAIVGGRPVTRPSRVSSTPAISSSKGSTNFSMPSRSSFFVTSPMSMPAPASASRSGVGSWSAVAPVTSSCSSHASRVGIGIVFTVCGATSESTYLVSG